MEGIDVRINNAGTYILTTDDSGNSVPVTLEEYKQRLAAKLVEDVPNLDDFRQKWVEPEKRRDMIEKLPDSGRSPYIVRDLSGMEGYDLYDVMGELAYGLSPKTMGARATHSPTRTEIGWQHSPIHIPGVIKAIASQFAKGGTESLESQHLFRTPEVMSAGGFRTFRQIGDPNAALIMTKNRMFAA